jgi:hypothetical protein
MKPRRAAALALTLPAIWLTYFYVVRPLIALGAALAFASTSTEIQRMRSPDHQVEVVVVESRPGLALEPQIGKNDLKFRWISSRLLEISYSDACIVSFRNHWEKTVPPYGGDYDVEIRLRPPQDGVPRPFCA